MRLGGLFCHTVGYATIYIRYFKTLYTIVRDVGYQINVLNIELTIFLSFGKDLTEQLYLCIIEVLSRLIRRVPVSCFHEHERRRRQLLEGPGEVSHEAAIEKAHAEYRKYQQKTLSPVEEAYLQSLKDTAKKVGRRNRREAGR